MNRNLPNQVDSWVAMIVKLDYSDVLEGEPPVMSDFHESQEEAEKEILELMNDLVKNEMYDIDEDRYRVVTFQVMEEDFISRSRTFHYEDSTPYINAS